MVYQRQASAFAVDALPPGRVAVLFSADWCGFSRRFYPHFKRLQQGWVVDISDESEPLWDSLAIDVVPTVILFEDGAPKRRWAGVLADRHVDEIETALSQG